MDNLRS